MCNHLVRESHGIQIGDQGASPEKLAGSKTPGRAPEVATCYCWRACRHLKVSAEGSGGTKALAAVFTNNTQCDSDRGTVLQRAGPIRSGQTSVCMAIVLKTSAIYWLSPASNCPSIFRTAVPLHKAGLIVSPLQGVSPTQSYLAVCQILVHPANPLEQVSYCKRLDATEDVSRGQSDLMWDLRPFKLYLRTPETRCQVSHSVRSNLSQTKNLADSELSRPENNKDLGSKKETTSYFNFS